MRLTLYTKPGCHLCDEMKAVIRRVIDPHPDTSIDEIDISSDPTLVARYGQDIPVLAIDGKKVAKFRISEEQLKKVLETRGSGFSLS